VTATSHPPSYIAYRSPQCRYFLALPQKIFAGAGRLLAQLLFTSKTAPAKDVPAKFKT
jgi:hypothetical protein